jgi:methionyl-tRNA formyltransferase
VIEFTFSAGRGGARLLSQPSGGRGRRISEPKASLVYKVTSRTAKATQRNPVPKNKTKQQQQKELTFSSKLSPDFTHIAFRHHPQKECLSKILAIADSTPVAFVLNVKRGCILP